MTSFPSSGQLDPAVLRSRAYLSRVAEPASIPVWAFVQQVGPVAAADAIRRGSAPASVGSATEARRDHADPDIDLETAQRHGIRLVAPESSDWPHFAFAGLERCAIRRARDHERGPFTASGSGEPVPPLALWVKGCGDLAGIGVRSVAIVGSRAATPYDEHVTADLAYGLGGRGVVIVSGGAYGIDAVAHRSALAGQGQTVVVSAGGLDRPYPVGNAFLFERAAESGLVVSESPPGCAPQRHRFLTRNRLIAAFSTGTVVTEAAIRSGAANTAAHAFTIGRPVMAVPGPITSPMSVGCHALLRREPDAAQLVTSVDDVMAVVGSIGEGLPVAGLGTVLDGDLRAELDRLDPTARRVFDALPSRRPARPDELALRSGVSAVEVIRALPVLDLADLMDVSDAGYRIAARLRPARRPRTG
jgi:DNA processing protein